MLLLPGAKPTKCYTPTYPVLTGPAGE